MDDKMLTTMDNPYDPHIDYESWMQWDQANGYYTSEYIARLMDPNIDYELDPKALDDLYNNIIKVNITGNYILV